MDNPNHGTLRNYQQTNSWDDLGPIFTAPGITHCRNGTVELRDAMCELIFTLPTFGGIIFSDQFIAALKQRLSETEEEVTNE